MRLKNIKLAGFKSFVDPTNVQLGSNMVAVVGPNGCGKSNIIDAVRWVMGESSAKNLRGESMADVIFNGSTARKPVGQASIELVFDNSDGTLKGEYGAFSEISIKRKVTRDGQSQYFINGAKCRRRDITDIFLGTGLGPRSYAIIEQGMISRLIESKPEELRVFIEEAAGISKYKERRRETETRIRHTRENLERLTDLREELERQLQKLKRQSVAAEKYKEYKTSERSLKAQTLSLQWQAIREQSSGQRQAIVQKEIDLEASIAEQRAVDAQLESLRESHIESTEKFNTVQAGYYNVGSEIARMEQTLQHGEQRAQQLAEDIADTERNWAESREHLDEDSEKMQQWQAELATIEPEHQQLSASESQSAEALKLAESHMQDWQQHWDSFNENAAEPQKNAEVQRSRIDQIEESLTGLGSRMERLQREMQELDQQTFEQQSSELQQTVAGQQEKLQLLGGEFNAANEQLQQQRQQQKSASALLDTARSELQQMRGKYASLEALQKSAQTDSSSKVRSWLETNKLGAAPRLLQQLKVQSGWETAVETVLGDRLQAISVAAFDDILASINSITDVNLSFVCDASTVLASANTAVQLPRLASKIEQGASEATLGNIYAAESLDAALAAQSSLAVGESIVTRDGLWMGADWIRVSRAKDASQGIIERQSEIEALAAAIATQSQDIESMQQRLEQSEAAVLQSEQQKEAAQQQKSELESALAKTQADLKAVQTKMELQAQRRKRAEEEIQLADQNQRRQREALTEARAKLDEAIASMQQTEQQREALLLERDKVRDALTVTRESAKTDRDALQAVAVRAEGLKAQLQSVQGSVERLGKQVEQLAQRQQSLRDAQSENAEPLPALKADLEQKLAQRIEVETHLGEARKAVETIDLSIREADKSRADIDQRTESIRATLEKARINSQEMEVRSKTIEEQLVESGFELQAVIDALPEQAELESWQQQLEEITRKIERLGAINLAAIEEFKTESERKVYLDTQNDELESALTTLENAIHKIDRETRSLFKETFDALNASLQDLFPKVFGGGAAYLEMTGDDLLNTGIAIMARPPGKRNSTIHLLSGGEKALTAIALVFSIFQLNPAPFCMLDEVDAPLDDANTSRYARLINEMSDRVQFIFITHNKITMEMADHLMGVTMHEPGCSRLVSVDIDAAVAMATA
jgi:chromosome segregation protein